MKTDRTCPAHGDALLAVSTRYGDRYSCPVDGCTVACWSGSTSTPADAETRDLRQQCHTMFDPLWKRKLFKSRASAYAWLANVMQCDVAKAHIGMFDADQCRKLLDILASDGVPV